MGFAFDQHITDLQDCIEETFCNIDCKNEIMIKMDIEHYFNFIFDYCNTMIVRNTFKNDLYVFCFLIHDNNELHKYEIVYDINKNKLQMISKNMGDV